MSFDADAIVDRRRLRRKVMLWRTLALIAAVAVIAAIYSAGEGAAFLGEQRPHVARVSVGGIIRTDRERLKMFERIGRSGAEAVIVSIDSPGGTVVGAEQLYDGLRRLAEKKPVVAVVNGLAASGGYVAALGTERIFAHRNAIVGSIGVLAQYPDVSGLLANLGVKVEAVRSAPLKAKPDMFAPTTPDERAALESLIMDSFRWFKNLVAERRNLSGARLDQVSDGRAFTGRQALDLGLVDEIGGEAQAREWLAANRDVSKDLPIRDWKPEDGGFGGFGLAQEAAAGLAEAAGFPAFAARIRARGASTLDLHALDGLLAIWHPSLQ